MHSKNIFHGVLGYFLLEKYKNNNNNNLYNADNVRILTFIKKNTNYTY